MMRIVNKNKNFKRYVNITSSGNVVKYLISSQQHTIEEFIEIELKTLRYINGKKYKIFKTYGGYHIGLN